MNKYILTVIDNILNPGKYTQEKLDKNAAAAAKTAAYAAYTAAAADTTHWLNRYFRLSGENKQDYIDAINKEGNRQACPHKQ